MRQESYIYYMQLKLHLATFCATCHFIHKDPKSTWLPVFYASLANLTKLDTTKFSLKVRALSTTQLRSCVVLPVCILLCVFRPPSLSLCVCVCLRVRVSPQCVWSLSCWCHSVFEGVEQLTLPQSVCAWCGPSCRKKKLLQHFWFIHSFLHSLFTIIFAIFIICAILYTVCLQYLESSFSIDILQWNATLLAPFMNKTNP